MLVKTIDRGLYKVKKKSRKYIFSLQEYADCSSAKTDVGMGQAYAFAIVNRVLVNDQKTVTECF